MSFPPFVLQSVTGCLAALQLVLIALWATHDGPARLNSVSVAAACVSFASSLMSCALSYFEHARSLGPSALLNVFLLVSLLLDAAVLRTVWLSLAAASIRAVLTASFALKAALLVLEGREKAGHVVGLQQTLAPEETSGLYSRAVFAWVAPLLRTGFRRLLRPADLFPLDDKMSTSGLNERFWWHWRKGGLPPKSHQIVVKEKKNTIPKDKMNVIVEACQKLVTCRAHLY